MVGTNEYTQIYEHKRTVLSAFLFLFLLFSVNFSAASTWRIHVNLNELFHIVTCLLLEVQGVCELGFMFYAFIPLSYDIINTHNSWVEVQVATEYHNSL